MKTGFDELSVVNINRLLNKRSNRRCFFTPWRMWRHCNVTRDPIFVVKSPVLGLKCTWFTSMVFSPIVNIRITLTTFGCKPAHMSSFTWLRVVKHERLRNSITRTAWENWNASQFNWCLYNSEISYCKSPQPVKCTTIICCYNPDLRSECTEKKTLIRNAQLSRGAD